MTDRIPAAPTPEGWAFVVEHANSIRRYCATQSRDHRVPIEDLVQEASIDIAAHHGSYDPERGSPSAWIWHRVRRKWGRLAARYVRESHAASGGLRDDDPRIGGDRARSGRRSTPSGGVADLPTTTIPRQHVAVMLIEVVRHATPKEIEAIDEIAAGWTEGEVLERRGVTRNAMKRRIGRLRARIDP